MIAIILRIALLVLALPALASSRLSQQISTIEFNVEELGQTVSRLRQQLRKLES